VARRYENIHMRLKNDWRCCRCQRKNMWMLREKLKVRRRKRRNLAFAWFDDFTVPPKINCVCIDSRTSANVVSYKLMCENSILTSSYLEHFAIRHQSQNLLHSITLQMNSETLYLKWGLLKNTLLHISDNSEERMRSRMLVMIPIITLFASLCYFMNGLAKKLIFRKLHRSILLKNCTFQNFGDFICEFTEFFIHFLSNYCLYPRTTSLSLSLFIYTCLFTLWAG